MSRLFASAVLSAGIGLALLALAFAPTTGCGASSIDGTSPSAAGGTIIRRDAAPVDPPDGGALVDSGPTLVADCGRYCDLVMSNCTGDNAQYASYADCTAFCAYLPPTQPRRDAEEKKAASVACRQY